MKTIKKWLLPYKQALPALLLYQIIATVASAAWLALFKWISGLLIRGTGKVAISSGDFLFLFKTWQGYVIILLAILTLFLLVAIDINPSVELIIKDGKVSGVTAANEDGAVLLSGETLEGMSVEAATDRIVALAEELGFLTDENNQVKITVVSDTPRRKRRFLKRRKRARRRGARRRKSTAIPVRRTRRR